MTRNQIEIAMEDSQFRKVMESISKSYLDAKEWQGAFAENAPQWQTLRAEHLIFLLNGFAGQLQRIERLEYEDVSDELNPLRNLWQLCFSEFAQKTVYATNHVSPDWISSAQDDKDVYQQLKAIQRNVAIHRTYIFDPNDLPSRTLLHLRSAIVQQLTSGITVRQTTPQLVDNRVQTSRLRTKDFIVFDDAVVYATIVDDVRDNRERRPTYAKLYSDKDTVEYASAAWDEIQKIAREVTLKSVDSIVAPSE